MVYNNICLFKAIHNFSTQSVHNLLWRSKGETKNIPNVAYTHSCHVLHTMCVATGSTRTRDYQICRNGCCRKVSLDSCLNVVSIKFLDETEDIFSQLTLLAVLKRRPKGNGILCLELDLGVDLMALCLF